MRRNRTLLSCFLFFTIGCGLDKTPSPPPGETFDAGTIFYETTPVVIHKFTMVNSSDRVVQVKEIKRSCTCTDATVSCRSIGPGELVELTLNVKAQPIERSWDAIGTLEVDDPVNPSWTCHLKFRTHPPVQFEKSTVDLGTVEMSGGKEAKRLSYQTTWLEMFESAHATSVVSAQAASFDLSIPAVLKVQRGSGPLIDLIDEGSVRRLRYPIHIGLQESVVSGLPAGMHAATITAKTVSGVNVSVAVAWNCRSPILVAPASVSFGIVREVGIRELRKFVIHATDNRPFRVLNVSADSDAVVSVSDQAQWHKQTSTQHTVEIAYRRSPLATKYQAGQIVVQTDHPEMPTLHLPWSVIAP